MFWWVVCVCVCCVCAFFFGGDYTFLQSGSGSVCCESLQRTDRTGPPTAPRSPARPIVSGSCGRIKPAYRERRCTRYVEKNRMRGGGGGAPPSSSGNLNLTMCFSGHKDLPSSCTYLRDCFFPISAQAQYFSPVCDVCEFTALLFFILYSHPLDHPCRKSRHFVHAVCSEQGGTVRGRGRGGGHAIARFGAFFFVLGRGCPLVFHLSERLSSPSCVFSASAGQQGLLLLL